MIKLIVSDIDGTLIKASYKNDPFYVSSENQNWINKALDNNIAFALATGRNHASAKKVQNRINLESYTISQNGTYIFDKNEVQLTENAFIPEETIKIVKLLTQNQIDFMINGPNTVAFDTFGDNALTPYIIDSNMGDKFLISEKLKKDFQMHAHRVGSFTIIPSPNQEFNKIEKLLRETIDNSKFEIVQSSEFTLDIVLREVSKASAILELCERLLITPQEVAVIGDNYNDLPMFKLCQNSYVMSSADPNLAKYASKTVDSVAEAIKDIMEGN